MWRVIMCDQETSNEEAKAHYQAVENITRRVVKPRKQTTTNHSLIEISQQNLFRTKLNYKSTRLESLKAVWNFNNSSLSCTLFTPPAFLVYCSQGDHHNQIPAASASADFPPWFLVLLDETLHMGKYPQSIL